MEKTWKKEFREDGVGSGKWVCEYMQKMMSVNGERSHEGGDGKMAGRTESCNSNQSKAKKETHTKTERRSN